MPITPTYPGVYIEELQSTVHTIIGVATSITAFVGRAPRGPVDKPVRVQSFAEYTRNFGGLSPDSTISFAVQQYFLNGGTDAIIVRVVHSGDAVAANNAKKATADLNTVIAHSLHVEASSEGTWGNNLLISTDQAVRDLEPGEAANSLFNLSVKDNGTGAVELFRNVSTDPNHRMFVALVLEQQSKLLRIAGAVPLDCPSPIADKQAQGGLDGVDITDIDVTGDEASKTGFYALLKADLFNLLCIPPPKFGGDTGKSTWDNATTFCEKRRAMLIVDSPVSWTDIGAVTADTTFITTRSANAVIYFPHVKMANPLKNNQVEEFVPCGVMAGVLARTDGQRGVWKAPAGTEAGLVGVRQLGVSLTDGENGQLNPIGINCLRSFPVIGPVSWGARTLKGADILASQWKYLPVRRLALYIEESLYRGTQWAVFEPNDKPLWSELRLNVGAFMHNLFRQGAFQGSSPRDAYLVKCDSDTTTQNDIDAGIVNILVGFAPLKPAEFVIIQIQQLAGQVQA